MSPKLGASILAVLAVLSVACDGASGTGPSISAPAALGSANLRGQWAYRGDGWAPEGQPNKREVSKTYTFLSDGTYVLETRSQESGSVTGESATGKWDVHPDSIILVQQHHQLRGSNTDDTMVVTSKIDAKLSADGKELTLHREDGDCPGSDCTRVYAKK